MTRLLTALLLLASCEEHKSREKFLDELDDAASAKKLHVHVGNPLDGPTGLHVVQMSATKADCSALLPLMHAIKDPPDCVAMICKFDGDVQWYEVRGRAAGVTRATAAPACGS